MQMTLKICTAIVAAGLMALASPAFAQATVTPHSGPDANQPKYVPNTSQQSLKPQQGPGGASSNVPALTGSGGDSGGNGGGGGGSGAGGGGAGGGAGGGSGR